MSLLPAVLDPVRRLILEVDEPVDSLAIQLHVVDQSLLVPREATELRFQPCLRPDEGVCHCVVAYCLCLRKGCDVRRGHAAEIWQSCCSPLHS